MNKNVLIVVDMQNDFISGALGSKEAETIVERVAEKVKAAGEEGALVIFTRDTHGEDYLTTEEGKNLPVPHCIEHTEGWQVSRRITSPQNSRSFDKYTFGSLALGRAALAITALDSTQISVQSPTSSTRSGTTASSLRKLPNAREPKVSL